MFTYNGDYNSGWGQDSTTDWNSRNQATTRALGGLQAIGGAVQVTAAFALASTCETGIGCAGALWLGGSGMDNTRAGSQTAWEGIPSPTLGGTVLQGLGLSPNAAEFVYGVTQLAPVAGEAIVANRAASALAKANSEAIAANRITNSRSITTESLSAEFLTSHDFAQLPQIGVVNPNTVRFSQDSVSAHFRPPYGSVDDFSLGLIEGNIEQNSIKPIRIVEKDGYVYTLDNRRLYGFQQAYPKLKIDIPYIKLDDIPKQQLFKFTTKNNGTSINIRKGK